MANIRFKTHHGLNATSNSTIDGKLEVTGDLVVAGNVAFSGTSVGDLKPDADQRNLGNTSLRWNLIGFSANLASTLTANGATSLSNTLLVSGAATLQNTLTVTGWVNTAANLVVGGSASISGNSGITGTLIANGNTSFTNGLLTINTNSGTNANTITIGTANLSVDSGALFVDGVNNRVGINNTAPGVALRVTGAVDISSTANVQGNANVGGTLGVAGVSTLSGNVTISGSVQSIAGNVAFDTNVLFVDSVNNRVGIGSISPGVALDVTGAANVSTSVNSALLTVGTNFIANTIAIVGTGYANITTSVNSALLTVGTNFIANTLGAYHTGVVNAASHTTSGVTANTTGVYPTSNSVGTTLGSATRRWIISANSADLSTGLGIGTIGVGTDGFYVNSTSISVGDTVNNVSITATGMTISVVDGLKPSSNISGHVLGSALQRWDLTASNGDFSHNVTIGGNLTVSGTTTYIDTTNLNVGDNIVTLNADLTGATAPTENAGLEINRGSSANVSFIWNETTDAWNLGNTTVTGAVTATTINTTGFQGNATALNPTSNTISFGNNTGRWVITANSVAANSLNISGTSSSGNTTITGFANVSISVNSALLTVGANFVANTTGAYHDGTVNAASFTTTNFVANTTGAYPLSNSAGTALGSATRRWVLAANTGTFSGTLSVTGTTTLTTLTANGSTGTAGQVLVSGAGTNVYWGSAGISIVNDTATDGTRYVLFNESTTGSTSNAGVSSTKLTFNPSSGILSAVEFTATSDERLKSEVTTIENALEVVSNLRGVNYVFTESGKKNIGVIAQEVELVIPEVVNEDQNGYKSVNYGNIVGLLIEAIKELKQEIKELKNGNQS